MKKLLTLFTMLLLCIGSTWAQDYTYIPVRRVTSFENGKSYMLYNTCVTNSDNRTGFIYVNTGNAMQKNVEGTSRNPKQFKTTNTAYLWRVTTGSDYHVALQNVSNSRYYGWRQGDNEYDPCNLYLYPWGTLTAKQSDVKSQNEDDPTQSTASADITFAGNKVFVIGGTGDGDKYWNGNPGDIVKWSNGHPFAFYDVEAIEDIQGGYNVYTGANNTTIGQTEWQTQTNWITTNTWNSNGPGYTNSNMWSPIYLKDVTAEGIRLEGWNFRAVLDHSTWKIANIVKIQCGDGVEAYTKLKNSSTVTMNFGTGHTYSYRIDLSEGTDNIFNLVMTSGYKHSCALSQSECNGTITVNYGTICQGMNRKFNASGTGNIKNLVLQATLADPSAENEVEDYPLVTYTNTNVGADNLTVTLSGPDGWTEVASQAALEEQSFNGKYYYVEKNSSGVTLHTFNETSKREYIVDSDVTLRQIDSYDTYDYFTVNSGVTLTVDVADFDLTRITGEGNVVLAASTSLTGSRSTAATGKLTVNSGVTLTIGSGDSQTNYVSSFTSIDLLGTLQANTIAGSGELTGTGTLRLLTFPTTSSVPTLTEWTGTVEFPADATDKGAIDAILNAWGNANSRIILNSVGTAGSKGQGQGTYFNGSKTITPAVEIAEGATVYLNNGNSGTKGIFTTLSGAGTLSLQWTGSYDQQINNLTDFTGTLDAGTNNRTITVKKLVLASAPYTNTRLFKTSASNVTLEKLYIGLQETTAYSWAINTVEGVTGIYVTDVDLVQFAREDAINTITPYYNYVGTGVGKYTVRLNNVDYTDINQIEATIQAWNLPSPIPVIITINQPTPAFYRIKSGSQYLQDVRKSDTETQRTMTSEDGANTAAKTLFYLNYQDEENKFIGYQTGYGFGNSVCQTQDTEKLNSVLFTASSEVGKYTIQSQPGTCASDEDNTGYWGVEGSDLSRKDNAAEGANWTMETVTSIPVTFKTAGLGYATFNSPVAVQIPVNTKAYVCQIGTDGNTLTFYEITSVVDASGEKTIPANTPVLLYNSTVKGSGSDVTVSFPVTTTTAKITNNSFVGTLATKAFSTSDSEKDTYSLRTNTIDGKTKVGFYKKTSGTTLAGFKAWLPTPHQPQARNFTIYFDGEDDATGIAEALGLDSDKVEIYDLNGRKLSGYQKGINIVNGKKIFK